VNDDIVFSFSEPIDIPTLFISVVGPYHGVILGYTITCGGSGLGASFDPDTPLQVGAYSVRVKCRDPSDNLAERDFVLTVVDPDPGEPGPSPTSTTTPTPTPAPTSAPSSAPKIVINELMPNPIGTDRGNETTELYNCGDDSVDIGGWVLKNEDGATYNIPAGTTIYRGSGESTGSIPTAMVTGPSAIPRITCRLSRCIWMETRSCTPKLAR
jgi:hypothetical protein